MKKDKKLAYIRRKPQQSNVPKEMIDLSMQYAGAESITGTRRAVTGLTQAEKIAIMPELISMSPANAEFDTEVNEFFHTLRIEVPANIGTKLNIATDGTKTVKVNDEDVKVDLPVNPLHYVLYKRCLASEYKQVATSLEEAYSLNCPYYLIDEATELENKATISNLRDKAFSAFLKIKEDSSKWDTILTVLEVNPSTLGKLEKIDRLRNLATGEGKMTSREKVEAFTKFIEAIEDKSIELRATVKTLVNEKIFIVQDGTVIYDNGVTTITLGDEDAAVAWMKDAKNSKDIAIIKSKLQGKQDKK
jgi:hypothetical protein